MLSHVAAGVAEWLITAIGSGIVGLIIGGVLVHLPNTSLPPLGKPGLRGTTILKNSEVLVDPASALRPPGIWAKRAMAPWGHDTNR